MFDTDFRQNIREGIWPGTSFAHAQEPMLIFDKSTIQSLTVDKAVLLGTEQTLTQVLY
jgi:hypothetical protein